MEEAIAHVKQTHLPSYVTIPVKSIFLLKYGTLPRTACIRPQSNGDGSSVVFHVKSLLDRINETYAIQSGSSIMRKIFHPCSKKYFVYEQLISLLDIDGIMIHLNNCLWVTNYTNDSKKSIQPDFIPDRHFLTVEEIYVFHLPEHEILIQKLANDLINDDTLSLTEPKIADLRLICKRADRCDGPGAFYLTGCIHIKKPYIPDLSISYGGHDFLQIHQKILAWLNKKDTSGLVLLHGAPGSGKTHYIRYLLHCLTNKTDKYLIYVPGDMINDLTSPRLLPLLLNYPNSLLVIEDAEGSLSRTRTSDQAVANLLNLTDGLLSDGLHIQILATFNCPLISLDPALLRPGRLVVEYCFPPVLTIENARCLAESIGITNIDEINQPLSLANIYAMRNEKIAEEEEEQDELTSSRCRKCCSLDAYGGEEE